MKKIGITGVMGAGKSSVAEILKEANYPVLDCDRINDELLLPHHQGYQQLVETFGTSILKADGSIDRICMSDEIFHNPTKKKQAEAILHPLIKQEIIKRMKSLQNSSITFVEVPLLYEIDWVSFFDEIWVVASEEALLLKRLMQYRGVDEQEAKRRLKNQLSQDYKIKRADYVLWNNSDKESLKASIYAILKKETKR